MKIHELLSDPSKWTQGSLYRDKEGNPAGYTINEPVCWCLYGALNRCYQDKYYSTYQKILTKMKTGIVEWNDAPGRTFDEVRQLVLELDV